MASKKLTMKVVGKRLDFLLKELVQVQQAADYINKLIVFYVDFKGDLSKFQKYLEDKNESGKSDSQESLKGDEKTSNSKSKSSKGKPKIKVSTRELKVSKK